MRAHSPGRPGWRVAVCLVAAVLLAGVAQVRSPPSADAAPASVGWLHTDGSTIRDAQNRPYTIKAVSWFGLETSTCAPHGLWQINLDDGLAQIRSFGFNTIRLPYANECLHASTATSIDGAKNPTLVGKTPLQVMDTFIDRAEAHGLSVILDRHRPDSAAQSALWYTADYPETSWIADWKLLANRYRNNPTVIGADLHNEPHGSACWGCGDPQLDWAAAAVRGGNAVLQANPHLLVVVEGIEHQGNGLSTWWGGGLSDVAAHPLTLAVANRLVYSPHDYPASISIQPWFSAPDYPANLPAQWDRTWGYLQQQGIAPVLMGEFGTKLETASDRQWLAALVDYLKTNSVSFAYWSFNPNSGDTGGLVQDDWTTPQGPKLAALTPLLGSRYAPTRVTSSRRPRPPAVPPARRAGLTADWRLQSSWPGGYVAQLTVSSAVASPTSGWSVHWTDPAATAVSNAWGMTCSVASGVITCHASDWARTIPAGGSVQVGLEVVTTGAAPTPPRLTVWNARR